MARGLLPSLTETKTAPFPSITEVMFLGGIDDRLNHKEGAVRRDQDVAGMEIFEVEEIINVAAFVLLFIA